MTDPRFATGCDVVEVARLSAAIDRRAGLLARVFTERELADARRGGVAPGSPTERARLAARFAAKEALAKALGAPTGMAWHDAEIVSEVTGNPQFEIRGGVLARANDVGVSSVHVSLSHDAGIASAVVVLES